MGLTVRDLFHLPITRNFTLIAGAEGLDRQITATEILDFEFVAGAGMNRKKVFEGTSLVLSSLLFAKDDASLLLDAVMRLCEMKASALAYKPVFFQDLPEEVLRFADENGFPILRFSGDEFFEDIILEVNHLVNRGGDIQALEGELEKVLERTLSREAELNLARRINPNFERYIKAVYVCDKNKNQTWVAALVRRYADMAELESRVSVCKFRSGYFILLSQAEPDEQPFVAQLDETFQALDVDKAKIKYGISTTKDVEETFGRGIREAYWACIVATLEDVNRHRYEEIGIYRFIVPEIGSYGMRSYMEEYLAPILQKEQKELLHTAEALVLSRGDLKLTAERLSCHKNTVRYRLAKMQELLDPYASDNEFYESLTMAIKILLLARYR